MNRLFSGSPVHPLQKSNTEQEFGKEGILRKNVAKKIIQEN